MLLGKEEILREIEEGHLVVTPFLPGRLKAASYVLTLGDRFRRWRQMECPIVLWSANAAHDHLDEPFESNDFTILPREFALGCTAEEIGIGHDHFGVISPLSHVARFGLGVHGGADFINPGHGMLTATRLTLELHNYNSSPLRLSAGMPIAHLRVGCLKNSRTTIAHPPSIYEGADPVSAPRLFEEWSALIDGTADA